MEEEALVDTRQQYFWSESSYRLPLKIEFEAKCPDNGDMCIGLFAKEQAEWSDDYSTETLSWFLSPHRDDFTFRT